MKSRAESIYSRVPIWAQDAIVSAYGYRLYKRRYKGKFNEYLKRAQEQYLLDDKKLSELQNKRLQKLVSAAAENVPYYRSLFRRHNIDPDKIKTTHDLERVPLLSKTPLRKAPEEFIDSSYKGNKINVIHTTGSTGTPLKIFCDDTARQQNFAYFTRFLMKAGLNPFGKSATLWGRIVVPAKQQSPPFWRNSYFQKKLLFSSYHLNEKNIPCYIRKLREFQPDYIDAYPSSIYAIARYAKKHRIDVTGVTRGITTSAETLFHFQRQTIEGVFGLPVFDQYGAAEMCLFVGQCQAGNYHIHTDYGIVEILRPDGTLADAGEEGEIVCTGFINPVMPLIRYRIGDIGARSEQPCTCGSSFPILSKLIGRKDDVIVTPEGHRIGRLSPVLKGFPVKECQYVQESISVLTVKVVKDKLYNDETERHIITELRKRLGSKIHIDFNYVDRIQRGPGGKLRSIVSLLDDSDVK